MSITINLEPEIERQLRIIAEEEEITIELLVKRIIEDYIREYKQSKGLEL